MCSGMNWELILIKNIVDHEIAKNTLISLPPTEPTGNPEKLTQPIKFSLNLSFKRNRTENMNKSQSSLDENCVLI